MLTRNSYRTATDFHLRQILSEARFRSVSERKLKGAEGPSRRTRDIPAREKKAEAGASAINTLAKESFPL